MKNTIVSKHSPTYDVIVIGGGPAGTTTATLLAQKGYKTLILEKSKFPRFSIGESLIPETYWPLKRLGMLDRMKNSHFVKKYSVQFISPSGREAKPFYFFETNPHESSMTWQVLRSEFDQMMIENATEHGAEIRQGVHVKKILFEEECVVGVQTRPANGNGHEDEKIQAQVVVDASGRNSLISRRFRLRRPYPELDRVAIFAHYENGRRLSGIDEGATIAAYIRDKLGWFWYIPLPNNIVSVGVVAPPAVLYGERKKNPRTILEKEIDMCSWIKARLTRARRVSRVYVLSDFSYRARQCAGNGWVLVGDAFGFLDPVYSSGILLALKSGEFAVEAIDEAFQTGDFSAASLGSFGPKLCQGMEIFRGLIHAFYTPTFSFGKFVREFPEHQKTLIDILSGDVFRDDVQAILPALNQYCALPSPLPLEHLNGNVKHKFVA